MPRNTILSPLEFGFGNEDSKACMQHQQRINFMQSGF